MNVSLVLLFEHQAPIHRPCPRRGEDPDEQGCDVCDAPDDQQDAERHEPPFDPRLIDELARRLAGSVPEGMIALRRDLEQNFKGVLQAGLAKFDLVTREEFDVQTAVLRRTREKLEQLEVKLREFESTR